MAKLASASNTNKKNSAKSSSIRTVAIDLNPVTYTEDFDLTLELTTNIDFYRGEECVTLRPVPGYLTESLERYKMSYSSKRPGMSPISSACIWGGLQSFRSQSAIKELVKLKERLRTVPAQSDSRRYNLISTWFKRFPMDILPSLDSGNGSLNISLPEPIKASLFGLAGNLGMSQGTLGAISIAEVLREQDSTLEGHKQDLEESVKMFLIICQSRLAALESVMEMLGQR